MESARAYQVSVAMRSLGVALVATIVLAILSHEPKVALAFLAGSLIGLANLFHIARSFHRLVKGGKKYLPFLPIEGVLRVVLSGAGAFIVVGPGPWLGYFTYIAGFVAPIAVAILVYKQQIETDCVTTSAANASPRT